MSNKTASFCAALLALAVSSHHVSRCLPAAAQDRGYDDYRSPDDDSYPQAPGRTWQVGDDYLNEGASYYGAVAAPGQEVDGQRVFSTDGDYSSPPPGRKVVGPGGRPMKVW